MSDTSTITTTIRQMIYDSLHITYELDTSSANRIDSEILSGMQYLQRYCNPDGTFEPGDALAPLLCEYVLRAEAGALATFATDYAAEILQQRLFQEVEDYAGVIYAD